MLTAVSNAAPSPLAAAFPAFVVAPTQSLALRMALTRVQSAAYVRCIEVNDVSFVTSASPSAGWNSNRERTRSYASKSESSEATDTQRSSRRHEVSNSNNSHTSRRSRVEDTVRQRGEQAVFEVCVCANLRLSVAGACDVAKQQTETPIRRTAMRSTYPQTTPFHHWLAEHVSAPKNTYIDDPLS